MNPGWTPMFRVGSILSNYLNTGLMALPMYEYLCSECEHVFTLRRRMAERDEATECPRCGQRKVRRLMSRIAIQGQRSEPSCNTGFG